MTAGHTLPAVGIAERRERELKRRETDILQAALRLFDREGWQSVTIERIAQEAEIGKGTVYLHFSSKEDICGRLAADFAEQLLARLREIDPSRPVLARMRAGIRVFFEAHRIGHRYHRVLDYCEHQEFRLRMGDGSRERLERIDAEIGAIIHSIVQQGIAERVFADRPIPVLLYGAQSAVVGALRMLGSECLAGADPEDYIEEITRFVLAGLMYQDQVPAETEPLPLPAAPA
jgi:AcrR family transcriptional regulator